MSIKYNLYAVRDSKVVVISSIGQGLVPWVMFRHTEFMWTPGEWGTLAIL